MLIFATMVLLTGLYMFTGHKLGLLEWKAAFKNVNIDGWKKIGKYTMFVSIFIYIIGVIAIIFDFE